MNNNNTTSNAVKREPQQKRYVLKDIPEMTVGNFLNNKCAQEMYLNEIKRRDESSHVYETDITQSNNNSSSVNNNNKSNSSLYTNSNTITNTTITQEHNPNITNVNINNYNYNYNITGNKNIIVQSTKSVAPQSVNTHNTSNPFANVVYTPNKNYNVMRQHVQTNNSSSSSTTGGNSGMNSNYPPSLENYITRVFQRCRNNPCIEQCQKSLSLILQESMQKGDMYVRNWDAFPLPEIKSNVCDNSGGGGGNNNNNNGVHSNNNKMGLKRDNSNNNNIQQQKLNQQGVSKKKQKQNNNNNNNSNNNIKQLANSNSFNNKNNSNNNNNNNNNTLSLTSSLSLTDYLSKTTLESFKPIIGTCTDLEKDYYRMIDAPDPSQIRPEHILKKSFKMLCQKWKSKTSDYKYTSEQFKSIRQDLTIQNIQNEFTVKVYETHARIALESSDLAQFNQCQTALIPLYDKNIRGNSNEFLAYRIIYTALYERTEMANIVKLVKKKYKTMPIEIEHAMKILKGINEPNYFYFFKMYLISPNMGGKLIEPFLPRIRIKALLTIAFGYYSEVSVDWIWDKLGFRTKEECVKFLEENKLKMDVKDGKYVLYCKDNIQTLNTSPLLQTLIQKKFGI